MCGVASVSPTAVCTPTANSAAPTMFQLKRTNFKVGLITILDLAIQEASAAETVDKVLEGSEDEAEYDD